MGEVKSLVRELIESRLKFESLYKNLPIKISTSNPQLSRYSALWAFWLWKNIHRPISGQRIENEFDKRQRPRIVEQVHRSQRACSERHFREGPEHEALCGHFRRIRRHRAKKNSRIGISHRPSGQPVLIVNEVSLLSRRRGRHRRHLHCGHHRQT